LFDFNLLLFLGTSKILSEQEVESLVCLIIGKEDVPEEMMGKIDLAVRMDEVKREV
jgi:hypothetical protein